MLGALVSWSKGALPIWAVDAFCGPCFHHAMNHLVQVRTAPSCPECPGMNGQSATWDRVGGDPSLEGFNPKACRHCAFSNGADKEGT